MGLIRWHLLPRDGIVPDHGVFPPHHTIDRDFNIFCRLSLSPGCGWRLPTAVSFGNRRFVLFQRCSAFLLFRLLFGPAACPHFFNLTLHRQVPDHRNTTRRSFTPPGKSNSTVDTLSPPCSSVEAGIWIASVDRPNERAVNCSPITAGNAAVPKSRTTTHHYFHKDTHHIISPGPFHLSSSQY